MDDQPRAPIGAPDPIAAARSLADIAERAQRLIADFLARQAETGGGGDPDPLNIGGTFSELAGKLMADPARLASAQLSLWQDYAALWHNTARRMLGGTAEPVATPDEGDRRFKDAAWDEIEVFNFIKQSYLLTAHWIQSTVSGVDGLDAKTANKVDFYTRQFVNALSPSNFLLTNPEVLRATAESGGQNLLDGLGNLLRDLERGDGRFSINMTDASAFEVGGNIAVTPGKVVFRNDLIELIQYTPVTEKVYQRPLLIMPPWINKFYILDLRQDNSLIKWAVDQGHTVFVISWVNPDGAFAHKTFDDYMMEGPLAALEAIEQATGERQVNVIGYCIGGTLLAGTLAYMAATPETRWHGRVRSATFLASMVDFEEPGELGVFIDEEQLAHLGERMDEKGYLEGRDMATTFNMMRDNDLIWSFVVHNYLLGKAPFPFDLLYWNSDSTRMPAAMHKFYLRTMYLENKLVEPGGISLDGVPIDLRSIEVPVYILSTREDHIAPWKSTYAATRLYRGPVRFVLSASGHIAGVVNPPAGNKYGYWTNDDIPERPDAWLDGAAEHDGSWWPDWMKWVRKHAGRKAVPARTPGDGALAAMEDAPGTYVAMRADDG
ncbi:MAG: class I poly(R)-hydroxyalkanoic acid synthase [Rhodospirillales bacterium]|jgi:polyhydroxyalkanoate synthase|nr:class I poly(R)-hydroxyalkanoic acid synthase [Rhodospirillales bacterium]MDP6773726.1 class I poly(R)-hydroxyalkanoic acid synthase [Rhodospirillales bacterium]